MAELNTLTLPPAPPGPTDGANFGTRAFEFLNWWYATHGPELNTWVAAFNAITPAELGAASADGLADEITAREAHESATNPHSGSASTSALSAVAADLVAHKTATPAHTAAQVGLGNVTNDAQIPLAQKGMAGGVAALDGDGHVVQDPASATETPGPGAIPKAGLSSLLDAWISAASTTVAGKVQLATNAEAQTGTDTSKAVTSASRRQAALSELRDMLGVFPGIIRPTLNLHAGMVSNDDCPLGAFSRSAPKTRTGPTGFYESVAPDKVARNWRIDGSLLGWSLEEQRTCYLMHNTNLLAGVWLQFFSPDIVGGHPDIFGGLTAVSIGKSSTEDVLVRQGAIITSDTLPISAKFYIKRLYGGQYTLAMYDTDTYANAFGVRYDANNQTILTTYGSLLSYKVDDGPAGYKVVEFTFNNINKESWVADIRSHTQSAPDIFSAVQIERGAFSTSLIKTTDSLVTRPADVWTIPTSAFAYNPAEGSIYSRFSLLSTQQQSSPYSLSDGWVANYIRVVADYGNALHQVMSGGVVQSVLNPGPIQANSDIKIVGSYKANDFASALNGASPVTSSSGAIPAVSQLGVGNTSGDSIVSGHLMHLVYFARRLSNSNNQLITA